MLATPEGDHSKRVFVVVTLRPKKFTKQGKSLSWKVFFGGVYRPGSGARNPLFSEPGPVQMLAQPRYPGRANVVGGLPHKNTYGPLIGSRSDGGAGNRTLVRTSFLRSVYVRRPILIP